MKIGAPLLAELAQVQRMGPGIKGYQPIFLGAKYLTTVNHIISCHNDL